MKTSLDCLPCYMRQALSTVRLSTDDAALQRQIMLEVGQLFSFLDFSLSPPQNAVYLYELVAKLTGESDPFRILKKQSNDFALNLFGEIIGKIQTSEDPLHAALCFAAGGNIIDYGAQKSFDAEQALANCLTTEFAVDDFFVFKQEISRSTGKIHVLYLADNCGEIVFDKILVDQLVRRGCIVTLAVRERPVINDATMQDALYVGMDSLCTVIVNGTSCPGTPLTQCSEEFKEAFFAADIILSKGQGNFETLSEVTTPIFFLLTVKCEVVARHIEEKRGLDFGTLRGNGEMIMMKN